MLNLCMKVFLVSFLFHFTQKLLLLLQVPRDGALQIEGNLVSIVCLKTVMWILIKGRTISGQKYIMVYFCQNHS